MHILLLIFTSMQHGSRVTKLLIGSKVSFLGSLTTYCRGVFFTTHTYLVADVIRAPQESGLQRSGVLWGSLYFHPLCYQILEEASNEALSAWRREITLTRRYGSTADWLHNPSNHVKPLLSSDPAPRRSTAPAARNTSTNKACCCLLHTWTLRPGCRVWSQCWASPPCAWFQWLVADSSNRAHSIGRSRQATLKSHLFPDAAAIPSLGRKSAIS